MLHGLVSMESFSYNGMMDISMLEKQQARLKLQQNYMDQNSNSIELCSSNSVPDQFQGFNERCLGSDDDFHKFVNFSMAGPDFGDGKMNMLPQVVAGDITMELESSTCKKSFNKRKAEDVVDDKCKDKRIKGEMEMEDVSRNSSMENSKALEVQKPDYIHVRARRGQATDSHSLAERARREKISKKMKCLQDLVPGCNKVTGKAGMLDEIINYVQSLQKQVEFLSMKLAAQNSTAEFNVENLPMKDISACVANFPAAFKSPAMASLAFLQLNPLQKEAVNCMLNATMNPHETETEGVVANASLSIPEQALNSSCENHILQQLQPFSTWNNDPLGLPNVYNMGFH